MKTLIDLYHYLCPSDWVSRDDPRRPGIIREMRAVVAAKNIQDARRVVEWWGWDSTRPMDAWIRKAWKVWKVWRGK